MRQIFEKNTRIMTNLLAFLYELGGESFHVDISPGARVSRMRICAKIPHLSAQTIKDMESTLRLPRQRDMEENYWYLSGESEFGSNLTLVALMTDCVHFSYQDGELTVELEREE
ncbi:MAG TPA: hypothetical protein PKE04_09655 [Clostridia bacterium]|nr:hypothetical protein [Clostridia bacterium]